MEISGNEVSLCYVRGFHGKVIYSICVASTYLVFAASTRLVIDVFTYLSFVASTHLFSVAPFYSGLVASPLLAIVPSVYWTYFASFHLRYLL